MLLNLIKNQPPDFDKIYLYIKVPFESKHQMLINRREKVGFEKLKNPYHYSKAIDDVLENLKDYNPMKKRRVLMVFDDMITDIEYNKTLTPIVTEKKINISLAFIS